MDPKLQECLDRDYPVFIAVEKTVDGRQRFAAGLIDFPGCIAQGSTHAEARERLEAIKPAYFQKLLGLGVEIPRSTRLPSIIVGPVTFYDERSGSVVVPGSQKPEKPKIQIGEGSSLENFRQLV